ncbi:hypothetical protein CLV24_1089 [Pontibacter ummariensis]|uniref:Membrane dipeptidase (Peptidase family M19) n=1 Tax=Pontibacter ummariensis TaxID=1610492 RepID=A0A239FGA6_9BACT|nr:hypothetical protein [Pontibacter ummariensis]PRY12266.1 hypothetical protein CLV24_1089 [Pontibacter ummariensis]SNS55959.1 hypothetical protein SAMN06296052_108176 [Pontibacter ummariensis]
MFQLPGEGRISCWDKVAVKVDDVLGNEVDSKSSLCQLAEGGSNLVCATLHPLEMAIAQRNLLYEASPLLGKYLQVGQLKRIASGETPYYELLQQEYQNLLRVQQNPDPATGGVKRIKVLRSFQDYNADDTETLHLIFNVEGGHAFYYGKNEHEDTSRILANLEGFVRHPDMPRLLYLTITHLSQNVFCNHAFGIKLFGKSEFIPRGNGLEESGKELILKCYTGLPYQVLVDIKHMSLKARKMLYDLRKEQGWEGIPLIASHIGVTGFSYQNMPIRKLKEHEGEGCVKVVYDKPEGYLPDTLFNPTSINLYDEDIMQVLLSCGLLGISFDERILGAEVKLHVGQKTFQKEFVSTAERELFHTAGYEAAEDDNDEEEAQESNSGIRVPFSLNTHELEELHMRHMVNNIFHIVKVGQQLDGVNPWKHICVGTDYDGFIHAVKFCPNASHFKDLPEKLKGAFEKYAPEAGIDMRDADEVVQNFLFRNAHDFLARHFA